MQPVILIAEDEDIFVQMFRLDLPELLPGYTVVVCTNRADARRYYLSHEVAALVVDRYLPPGEEDQLDLGIVPGLRPRNDKVDKDGGFYLIQDLAAIACAGEGFNLPTLFISCADVPWGDYYWLQRLYVLNTFDELRKPFPVELLAKRLLQLIKSSRRGGS